MKMLEAKKKLQSVKDREDFEKLFFVDTGEDFPEPVFEIAYKSYGGFTNNESAALYNDQGICFNSYMKFEDGYLPYPF